MGFEIDYLAVGEGEKGGDAIVFRYGDLLSKDRKDQKIIVIDGGTKESGKKLVNHIKLYYNTDYVDLVVCSHIHSDHSSGLTEVLTELKVGQLFMHLPWKHSSDIKNMFVNDQLTHKGIKEKVEKSLTSIKDLEVIANQNRIPIIEPFQGLSYDNDASILVLSPDEEYYNELLANFDILPETKDKFTLFERTQSFGKRIIKWVSETLDHITETLGDDGETNPENNSSTIILFRFGEKRFLFTGDAGIPAIERAIKYADTKGIDLSNVDFLDLPHHGSKRNIGKTLIQHFKPNLAIISAPTNGDPKHPSRKVVNALKRRGAKVLATKGSNICHSNNAPERNWTDAKELPFYNQVED